MKTATCFSRYVLPGLTLLALACPTQAQVANPGWRALSKNEAILGGASALAAITAQQSGRAVPAIAAANRNSYFRRSVQPYASPQVSSDRPDVFNSVALSIGRSSLDARWSRVSGAGVGGSAGSFAAALRDQPVIARAEAINSYVNARVRFTDDRVQFGTADRWLAASETLARGRGDCEDYAIAKRAMLRAAGVPDKDLYLVVLKDLSRRADHAVLVVRAAGRFLVLDNGTDRIVDSRDVVDYRPILTFAAGRTYTHGYRRNVAPPITYAVATATVPLSLAEARVEPAFGERELPDVVRDSVSLVPTTVEL
ncbi:MAG TPA: transglutaminase-like cysteine peptidase [Sphingomicrobium sp.]|nr:transglutaminase-like cysteine peptidase [Sphingomicrobium sp.]